MPRLGWVRLAALFMLAGIAGCKGCDRKAPEAPAFEASCDKREVLSQCIDYRGAAFDGGRARSLRESCAIVRGKLESPPCPLGAGWVGSCEVGRFEVRRFYDEGGTPFRAESAKRECEVAEGVWRAP